MERFTDDELFDAMLEKDVTRKSRGNRVPSRYQALVSGTLTVQDLDDEEIIRGQLRNKDGGFSGQRPKVIPRQMHEALANELIRRGERKMLGHLDDAQNAILELVNNPRTPAMARLEAAKYLWERVQGKIPETTFVNTTVRKFEELVDGGSLFMDIPAPDKQPEDIVDAEIVVEEPNPKPEPKPTPAPAPRKKRRKRNG